MYVKMNQSHERIYFFLVLVELNLQGKNVAVFGLGDQISYGENYADASGEVRCL